MALCEAVRGCTRSAETTVPMFMGSVRLCGPCALEATRPPVRRSARVRAGDYVRVRNCVGVVDRITPDGWYAVACPGRGGVRVRMVSRGMLRPV